MENKSRLRTEMLALLPVLFFSLKWQNMLAALNASLFAFWATEILFARAVRILPPWFRACVTVLWISALCQLTGVFLNLEPVWILSAFVLSRPDFNSWLRGSVKEPPAKIFRRGLYYYVMGLLLTFFVRAGRPVFENEHWAAVLYAFAAVFCWVFSRWGGDAEHA